MGRSLKGNARFVKKAGRQVPERVRALMKRLHPTVQILWAHQVQRWALVQVLGGRAHLIRILGRKGYEPPTLANTVYYLNSVHPTRFKSQAAQDQFLSSLDRSEIAERVKKNAQDRAREGSIALFDKLNNKIVVPVRA